MTDVLPAILVLAAGSSRRMRGLDKLMEDIDGRPLIARIVAAALETGCKVWVTLPPDNAPRRAALADLSAEIVVVTDAANGMAASLCAGIAAIPVDAAVVVLLADLPEITTDDLQTVIRQHQNAPDLIYQATSADGSPGHPVIFPSRLKLELLQLTGDMGANAMMHRHANLLVHVALPKVHATTDLDTPEDWANWRKNRQ